MSPAPPAPSGGGTLTGSVSFDRMADRYDETRGGTRRGELVAGAVAAHLPGRRVLEVGIGTGVVADALARGGCSVAGVDLSLPMLRHAHGRLGAAVAQADGFHLPVRSGAVDAVVMVWVLHLVARPGAVLAEAARVLRPGGRVVVVSARHVTEHDDVTRLSFGLGERFRPQPVDDPDRLPAVVGGGLRLVATDFTPYAAWQTSPNHEADRVEQRVWSSLWDVDDERWAREVAPVVRALRALPEPDRPREHHSRHQITVLERPAAS